MFLKSQLATGWRGLIGCRKLQVILRKRASNYRALLRKMTYGDKASYDSTPPCTTKSATNTVTIEPTFEKTKFTSKSDCTVTMGTTFEK